MNQHMNYNFRKTIDQSSLLKTTITYFVFILHKVSLKSGWNLSYLILSLFFFFSLPGPTVCEALLRNKVNRQNPALLVFPCWWAPFHCSVIPGTMREEWEKVRGKFRCGTWREAQGRRKGDVLGTPAR